MPCLVWRFAWINPVASVRPFVRQFGSKAECTRKWSRIVARTCRTNWLPALSCRREIDGHRTVDPDRCERTVLKRSRKCPVAQVFWYWSRPQLALPISWEGRVKNSFFALVEITSVFPFEAMLICEALHLAFRHIWKPRQFFSIFHSPQWHPETSTGTASGSARTCTNQTQPCHFVSHYCDNLQITRRNANAW